MPFICIYRLNNGAIQSSDTVIFKQYIDESFGRYHRGIVKIAQVAFNNHPAFIYSNSPGFPSTQGALKPGDQITSETEIAYFSAEGEDIPYGQPYATIRLE